MYKQRETIYRPVCFDLVFFHIILSIDDKNMNSDHKIKFELNYNKITITNCNKESVCFEHVSIIQNSCNDFNIGTLCSEVNYVKRQRFTI